jgi:hypothetical protein
VGAAGGGLGAKVFFPALVGYACEYECSKLTLQDLKQRRHEDVLFVLGGGEFVLGGGSLWRG